MFYNATQTNTGISTKTAEYIAELYPGWSQLLAAFKEKSVDDIKKFDSTKRIGIKKIQKIKEYSYNDIKKE